MKDLVPGQEDQSVTPAEPGKQGRGRRFLRFFLPVAVIGLSIVVVMGLAIMAQSKRPERRTNEDAAVLVEVLDVERRPVRYTVTSQGTVQPRTETVLVPEVSGKIVEVSPKFIAGGFFEAGETLLRVDPSDYETAVRRAEANLASMRARLVDEQTRYEQALKDWRNLGRSGEPSDLVLRKPQLADAQANVLAAEADLAKTRRDLQRTRISVPYDGLVRDKRVDIGQYVAPGTQLGTTYAVDLAEVRLPLSAGDIAYLELPSATGEGTPPVPVTLRDDDPSDTREWQGRIVRTEGVVDEQSRVIYAVAEVPDPYGVLGESRQPRLQFGTFVSVEITGREAASAAVLPRSVLRRDNTVLVANKDRELEVRAVEVLRAGARDVYIGEGLEDGDRVVTTSLDAPIPGTRLAIVGEEPEPADDGDDAGVDTETAVANAGDTP